MCLGFCSWAQESSPSFRLNALSDLTENLRLLGDSLRTLKEENASLSEQLRGLTTVNDDLQIQLGDLTQSYQDSQLLLIAQSSTINELQEQLNKSNVSLNRTRIWATAATTGLLVTVVTIVVIEVVHDRK